MIEPRSSQCLPEFFCWIQRVFVLIRFLVMIPQISSDIFVTLDLEVVQKILPLRYFRSFQHNLPVWVVCLKTCPVPLKTARTCHGDCCKELIATVVGSMTFIRIRSQKDSRIFKNFACKMSHGSFLSRHLAVWHDVVALDCTTRTSLAVLHLDL